MEFCGLFVPKLRFVLQHQLMNVNIMSGTDNAELSQGESTTSLLSFKTLLRNELATERKPPNLHWL